MATKKAGVAFGSFQQVQSSIRGLQSQVRD